VKGQCDREEDDTEDTEDEGRNIAGSRQPTSFGLCRGDSPEDYDTGRSVVVWARPVGVDIARDSRAFVCHVEGFGLGSQFVICLSI
jgi:hypothetical protein